MKTAFSRQRCLLRSRTLKKLLRYSLKKTNEAIVNFDAIANELVAKNLASSESKILTDFLSALRSSSVWLVSKAVSTKRYEKVKIIIPQKKSVIKFGVIEKQ